MLTVLTLACLTVTLPARSLPTPTLLQQEQVADGQARTAHLEVDYPQVEEARVREFLGYAEEIYATVDSLMDGALPSTIRVILVSTGSSAATPEAIVLSLQQERYVEPILARELVRLAGREIAGAVYDAEGYRFFTEGLAAWVGERYERRLGSVEPRWLWLARLYASRYSR
jgi:hypothetical protein